MIEEEGYATITAASGPDAIKAVDTHRPHLVLLDVSMPGMDGFEVLETLARRGGPKPKVIMLTAMSEEHHRRRALQLGAVDYFCKGSFNVETLLCRVAEHVAA